MYDCFSTNVVGEIHFNNGILNHRFGDVVIDQFGDGAIEKLFRAPLADISNDVVYQFRNWYFQKILQYVLAFFLFN